MEEANQILHKTGEKLGETFEQVRKTTMQASEKVQSCFDARLACMIVGIITSIIFGLAVLASIGGLIYVGVVTTLGYGLDLWQRHEDGKFRMYEITDILLVNGALTLSLVLSLMEFSFSVVLAHGASKSLTGHLQAYFVYANVKNALLFITSIILYIVIWDNAPGSLVLLCTGVNVAFTIMVRMGYKKVKESNKGYTNFDNETVAAE